MSLLTVVLASFSIGVLTSAVDVDRPSAFCADHTFDGRSFAVYVLSSGRGVPEEAFDGYQSIKSRLQQMQHRQLVALLRESRIGIEGERRLCVVFNAADVARNTWIEFCETLREVPLINLEIEECKQD